MWTLITPTAAAREFLGADLALTVEPYFYHRLKTGTIPLWEPTIGTGSPFLSAGTHHRSSRVATRSSGATPGRRPGWA